MQTKAHIRKDWTGQQSGPVIDYWTLPGVPGLQLVPEYILVHTGFNGGRFAIKSWRVALEDEAGQAAQYIAAKVGAGSIGSIQQLLLSIDQELQDFQDVPNSKLVQA